MSLDELDRWLRAPRKRKPAADGISMLDGFVAAIGAGPATYEPLRWLCPLLGVTGDAINDGGTEEYAALAAAAKHHNALSATLSEAPGRFAPIFGRDVQGAIHVGPWCRGFHAAIQLNLKFWRKLAKTAARLRAGAYVADPDPGALHRRRRPASLRHATTRSAGALRRLPRNPGRRRCHPRVLGSYPIQPTLVTTSFTRAKSRLTQAARPRCYARSRVTIEGLTSDPQAGLEKWMHRAVASTFVHQDVSASGFRAEPIGAVQEPVPLLGLDLDGNIEWQHRHANGRARMCATLQVHTAR